MASVDKKIAKFLKTSSDLEQYLHEDGALTPLQQQTIDDEDCWLCAFGGDA